MCPKSRSVTHYIYNHTATASNLGQKLKMASSTNASHNDQLTRASPSLLSNLGHRDRHGCAPAQKGKLNTKVRGRTYGRGI